MGCAPKTLCGAIEFVVWIVFSGRYTNALSVRPPIERCTSNFRPPGGAVWPQPSEQMDCGSPKMSIYQPGIRLTRFLTSFTPRRPWEELRHVQLPSAGAVLVVPSCERWLSWEESRGSRTPSPTAVRTYDPDRSVLLPGPLICRSRNATSSMKK